MLIHGPAPQKSTVAIIGQAWNWALRTLARRGLADEVSKLVYHVDHAPYASKLRLKHGAEQVGDTAHVGSAADEEQWTRAAWRLAITLVGQVTQRHGQQWAPASDILAKAF